MQRCNKSRTARVATSQVLVVVIFVDWFYQINEWLLVRSDGKRACTALVAGTLLFYLGSVIAIIFMFRSYAPKASCGANIAFLSLTLIGACPAANAARQCVCCGAPGVLLLPLDVLQAERWTALSRSSSGEIWIPASQICSRKTQRGSRARTQYLLAPSPHRRPCREIVVGPKRSRCPVVGNCFGPATC